jgi:hypothetical protein
VQGDRCNLRARFFVLGMRGGEVRMAAHRSASELERCLAERADHLLRTAMLLTGSKEAGEDLLKTARSPGPIPGPERPELVVRLR